MKTVYEREYLDLSEKKQVIRRVHVFLVLIILLRLYGIGNITSDMIDTDWHIYWWNIVTVWNIKVFLFFKIWKYLEFCVNCNKSLLAVLVKRFPYKNTKCITVW